MTDRELTQILRVCANGDSCLSCEMRAECKGFVENLLTAANRLEALLAENEGLKAQLPKWVSVDERLPELNVMVVGNDGLANLLSYDGTKKEDVK